MRTFLAFVSAVLMFASSSHAAGSISTDAQDRGDNPTREFVMACTYGVLAGTLVGAASLAFTSKPSDNMNKVARGASLGLYAGILLGLYVVYVVPGMEENPDEIPVAKLDKIPFLISPTFHDGYKRLDGVRADWTVLHF
jgi:hypothetical protein